MREDSFRVAMRLAYNGGAFYGFQSQKGEKTFFFEHYIYNKQIIFYLNDLI